MTHGVRRTLFALGVSGYLALWAISCDSDDGAASMPLLDAAVVDVCALADPGVPPGEISIRAIRRCQDMGPRAGQCLDLLFAPYLQEHTTGEALALLQRFEDDDEGIRASCHPIAHAIGRGTFVVQGSVHDAFAACDQTCHSGCYHGAMERFLRGDGASCDMHGHLQIEELEEKAAVACDPSLELRVRFQCLHGLGHAIMYYSDYDLRSSLAVCDSSGDSWAQSACWGGVFMENLVAATLDARDLSDTDYHYPCNAVDEKYRYECYGMQTSRMSEMGLSAAQIFAECRDAGAQQHVCDQSLGRDLSNGARTGGAAEVSRICAMGEGEEVAACTRGVVYALVDNTWDGRYAMPYCATYTRAQDVSYCFRVTVDYLVSMYEETAEDVRRECMQHAPDSPECTAPLG